MAAADPERKRLNFDPTINAGHILTFVAGMVAVGASYSLLSTRVGVLEEKASAAVMQQNERQAEQKDTLKDIKQDVKDLRRSVDDLSRAVAAKSR